MDLPHNPTCPEQLYQQVQKEVKDLWAYIQNRKIPAISSEIRWKKQPYGAYCTVIWKSKNHCHCDDKSCLMGKYVLKETTVKVKNNFSLEALRHFISSEKQWLENFVLE